MVALFTLFGPLAWGMDNGGLGPLSVRNQFPPALPYLRYTPGPPIPLPAGEFQVRYQYAYTNAFINTQSPKSDNVEPEVITAPDVAGGLDDTHFPDQGYGVYLDMELVRHLFRFDYGLFDSLELGLELAWITVDSGFLDQHIDTVETIFGGVNPDRKHARHNQFDYYIYYDNKPVVATSKEFSKEFQDPVFNLKWNLSSGSEILPAISAKLSYKHPIHKNPKGSSAIVNSGGGDYSLYWMLAKAVGNVVGHIQFGRTKLDVKDRPFANELSSQMIALEFRRSPEHSWVVQSMTQTSIFLRDTAMSNIQDFSISRQTDVAVLGYKYRSDGISFEIGTLEDYNQQDNESDITFYIELGGAW